MLRLALFVTGVSVALAGYVVYLDRKRAEQAKMPMQATKAASRLREAWAGHNTRA